MEKRARELIANKLRSVRAELNYTIEYVANNSNVNKDTISRYENNQVSMQIDILEKLIQFYGYNFDFPVYCFDANKFFGFKSV